MSVPLPVCARRFSIKNRRLLEIKCPVAAANPVLFPLGWQLPLMYAHEISSWELDPEWDHDISFRAEQHPQVHRTVTFSRSYLLALLINRIISTTGKIDGAVQENKFGGGGPRGGGGGGVCVWRRLMGEECGWDPIITLSYPRCPPDLTLLLQWHKK